MASKTIAAIANRVSVDKFGSGVGFCEADYSCDKERQIIEQFFQLGAIVLLVLGLGGYIWNDMHKRATKPEAVLAADGTKGAIGGFGGTGSGAQAVLPACSMQSTRRSGRLKAMRWKGL